MEEGEQVQFFYTRVQKYLNGILMWSKNWGFKIPEPKPKQSYSPNGFELCLIVEVTSYLYFNVKL